MVSGISSQGISNLQNAIELTKTGSSESSQVAQAKSSGGGGCSPCTNCGACGKIQDPSTVTQSQLESPIDLRV
ncbi:MAG: hypothetical protein WCG95_08675 [bacterium]